MNPELKEWNKTSDKGHNKNLCKDKKDISQGTKTVWNS